MLLVLRNVKSGIKQAGQAVNHLYLRHILDSTSTYNIYIYSSDPRDHYHRCQHSLVLIDSTWHLPVVHQDRGSSSSSSGGGSVVVFRARCAGDRRLCISSGCNVVGV